MLISGRYDRRRVIVEVAVLSRFASPVGSVTLQPLKALLDTGASSTSLAPEAARKLALAPIESRDVRTASGWHRARVYEFMIGFFPDAQSAPYVLPEPVAGLELSFEGSPFDILLGMDVISQGNLSIRRDGTFSFEF
jgi:predicted aspartyl protease